MSRIEHEKAVQAQRRRRARAAACALTAACALAAAWALSLGSLRGTPSVVAEAGEAPGEPGSARVDAVDFGERTGSIFYVASGAATTTAVVWLSDDAHGAHGDGL